MIGISDSFGRTFKTLRVSLTNTCNLACTYCVDPSQEKKTQAISQPTLTTEQYIQLIKTLHAVLQLETVRLTGGEPTLYKQLVPLVKGINEIGIPNIKMTSNAVLLENKAFDLKDAGLRSINISLDAIDPDVSLKMNQRKSITKILKGIDKSLEAGIDIKINCVVMKGANDHHILDLFEYSKSKNIRIRFLELMEMGHLYHNFHQHFFSEEQILAAIAKEYVIKPLKRDVNATANYWVTEEGFKFGIISNVSSPFCNDCNRLRLDSYGNIYGCLSSNTPINILSCINDEEKLTSKLSQALLQKKNKFSGSNLSMMHIGG